jgi:hypothetical protein
METFKKGDRVVTTSTGHAGQVIDLDIVKTPGAAEGSKNRVPDPLGY